jgi:D-3-phosphoglycerate dehydrogenase
MGLNEFDSSKFNVSDSVSDPDAILLRSFDLHSYDIPDSVQLIVRAGAGTNNIPHDLMTKRGIPVLNTPGANANAVKELVVTGMLLACRNICAAWDYVNHLNENDDIHSLVEKQKKQYAGFELPNKTLGIIGLGNIGVKVANAALALDMKVVGYDPGMTVQNAWELSASVKKAESVSEVLQQADFVSVHVPLIDATRHLINAKTIKQMRKGAILLNFARNGIVDNKALLDAIQSQHISRYVCDFPEKEFLGIPEIICLPHLGASTREAEENCAVMAAHQIMKFLTVGEIKHSINFPNVKLAANEGNRIAVINANVPNMVAQISSVLSDASCNIIDMINKSRDDIAYTMIDIDGEVGENLISELTAIEGVIRAKII